ncbi:hypothetical protein GCM10022405_07210 [Gibbsiella dentisursi]|uniref:Phosphoribosyltransferase domain-containing protein n=1 Tax=Gibbsiella dentisursi TaxID=796890 RepID=A0ABP7KSD7_9GAMM
MVKVITALGVDFDILCEKLSDKIICNYSPDLIIGIATGGEIVARTVALKMDTPVMILKRQRGLTKYKSRFNISKILPFFPRWFNDFLRRYEIKYNERRFLAKGKKRNICDVMLISGELDNLSRFSQILLIDDSVDSGGTMIDCVNFLQKFLAKNTTIKTASLNVTFKEPAFIPDFYLYKDVLIRCPWANDVRRVK